MESDIFSNRFLGLPGCVQFATGDKITRKVAMLVEGECAGAGSKKAAEKFGFGRLRYFQLRAAFLQHGATGGLRISAVAPSQTTAGPGRSCARLFDTGSSTRRPMPAPSRASSGNPASRSAPEACSESSRNTAFRKRLCPSLRARKAVQIETLRIIPGLPLLVHVGRGEHFAQALRLPGTCEDLLRWEGNCSESSVLCK
jgi:hypothetical protein